MKCLFLLTFFIFTALFASFYCQEVAQYAEIKEIASNPNSFLEVLLVDVREPWELEETGSIPTSINIPIDTLEWALNLIPPKFTSMFARDLPKFDDAVITTCKSGARAKRGAELLVRLGFINVKYYEGAWNEWCVLENQRCYT